MKTLNLDDYGLEHFTPENLNALMTWHRGKKIDPRKYRARFNLRRGSYGDKEPFIWTERLADWRRLERLYHRTQEAYWKAQGEYWDYLKKLYTLTQKQCGKKVEGYYLQQLNRLGKAGPYLDLVTKGRHDEGISKSSRARSESKAWDASIVWIWLGTPEEKEANRLDRRAEQLRRRFNLAEAAFTESVRIRLASWWKKEAADNEDYRYRKVFTAIENEGRSYGWISGMGGQGDLVWSPDEPPIFFK